VIRTPGQGIDEMRPYPMFVLVLAVMACRHNPGSVRGDWSTWFDARAAALPVWETPRAAGSDMGRMQTPDGLVVVLGDGYKSRNNSGCWSKRDDLSPGPGWRDVCVQRLDPGMYLRADYFLKPQPNESKTPDKHLYEDWQAGLVRFGQRRAVVERARASGGVEGARHQRITSVLIEIRPGEWAILEGRAGDDAGYEEFLAMAGTVRRS
jgi:hypothetical protein